MKIQTARIYGRFSSLPQERGDSKRRQVEGAVAYAETHGINLLTDGQGKPSVYFDEGVSGKAGANLEREFGRLLKEAKEGEIILCEALDRIGRQNPFVIGNLVYQTTKRGIEIITWQDGKRINAENLENLETQFLVFTGAAVGHQDNQRKMKRLRETSAQALIQGEKGIQSALLLRYLPQCFEWDAKKEEIIVNKQKAGTIKKIFDWYAEGTGRTSIAQKLNAEGEPTLYKRTLQQIGEQKGWMETTVSKVLRNESYAGVLNVRGKKIKCIPSVIDRDLFDRCQLLLARHSQRAGNLTGRVNNIFTGLGKCKYCGGTINVTIANPGKYDKRRPNGGEGFTYYSYRCRNARLKICRDEHGTNYPHKLFPARIVETMFFDAMFGGIPENAIKPRSNEIKLKIQSIELEIEKCAKAINNLYDLVESGDPEAKSRLAKRKDQNEDLEQQLTILRGSAVEQDNLPSMIQELALLIAAEKYDTKKQIQEYKRYLGKMQSRLQDNELRKKIANVLPSIIEKVVFDCINGTIRPFPKDATSPLPRALIYARETDSMLKKVKAHA